MTDQAKHELVLDLTLDAPAEKLFQCYSDPKLLQQWFAPKPWTIKSTDIDFRPGGRMAFVMASPKSRSSQSSTRRQQFPDGAARRGAAPW